MPTMFQCADMLSFQSIANRSVRFDWIRAVCFSLCSFSIWCCTWCYNVRCPGRWFSNPVTSETQKSAEEKRCSTDLVVIHRYLQFLIISNDNSGQATFCVVLSSGCTRKSHSRMSFVLGPGGCQTATMLIITCLFVNDCMLMAVRGSGCRQTL